MGNLFCAVVSWSSYVLFVFFVVKRRNFHSDPCYVDEYLAPKFIVRALVR